MNISESGLSAIAEPFFKQYTPLMLRKAHTRFNIAQDAEDIVSCCWLKLLPRLKVLNNMDEKRRVAYILTCVQNESTDFIRRQIHERQHLAELGYELQRPVHTDITNFISLKSELDDILSVCTGQEYSVLCGKCIGLSDEEIAAKMHVSKSTVRVYWHRAKKRIRDMVLRNASDV